MSDETPRLRLAQLVSLQELNAVTWNEALAQLDALVDLCLLGQFVNTPPASPADGDAYLLGSAPGGAWSGYANKIATCRDGAWQFATPFKGLLAFVPATPDFLVFNGTAWVSMAALLTLQNLAKLGINCSADGTNKLAVASPSVLFNHAGNGVTAKLNKNAPGDTASLLFQTGYSGRAEAGLCGDNDFHLKVSPDGSTWSDAFRVAAASGWISAGTPSPLAPVHLNSASVTGLAPGPALANIYDTLLMTAERNATLHLVAASSSGRYSVLAHRARGDFGSLASVQPGDYLFSFIGGGYDGAAFQNSAMIGFTCDDVTSSGHVPTRIGFFTGTNSSDRVERLSITSAGAVGINTPAPLVALDVGGPVRVKSYTVASLPSAALGAGQIVYVSDESGGAVLTFSDGTVWRRVTDRAVVS